MTAIFTNGTANEDNRGGPQLAGGSGMLTLGGTLGQCVVNVYVTRGVAEAAPLYTFRGLGAKVFNVTAGSLIVAEIKGADPATSVNLEWTE